MKYAWNIHGDQNRWQNCSSYDKEAETKDEAVMYAIHDIISWEKELKPGVKIEIGEVLRHTTDEFIPDIVEAINEMAWDNVGEFAGDWPNISQNGRAELRGMIVDFINERHRHSFYTIKNDYEHEITQSEIARSIILYDELKNQGR